MSFTLPPHAHKEYIVPFLVNIIAGVALFFLTKNILYTVIGVLCFSIIIYVSRIVMLHNVSGLKRYYKDSPDPTTLLNQYFKESNLIRLLAIRGARMLGNDRSLINYIIRRLPRDWEGRIEILILDPNGEHIRERARELNHDPDTFATECGNSIRNIFRLKDQYNVEIEVRTYNRKPTLRTIIFDDRALLSYYIGSEGHIPIQYELQPGSSSLYRLVNLLYDNIWLNSEEVSEDQYIIDSDTEAEAPVQEE